jgi:hypothetical protein
MAGGKAMIYGYRSDTKNSSWQAKHLIPHTTVTFCGDCMKMYEDLTETLATKELLHHDMHFMCNTSFFTKEFMIKINMTVILHPPFSPDLSLCNFSVVPIEDNA